MRASSSSSSSTFFFFFNDTATTEIYTLSLHDALPICAWQGLRRRWQRVGRRLSSGGLGLCVSHPSDHCSLRSEEHTSELQSLAYLVCRLLLEKKKKRAPRPRTQRLQATIRGPEGPDST